MSTHHIQINQIKENQMATYTVKRRRYGLINFIGDCIMTCITAGFWLIWVFIRESRR